MAYSPTPEEELQLADMSQPQAESVIGSPFQTASLANPPPAVNNYDAVPTAPTKYDAGVQRFESGGNPDAKNPLSSAHGKYQFLAGTFKGVIKAHPELAGLSDSDPRVLTAFTSDNAKILAPALGRTPTQMDSVVAHFLGAGGAIKFLKAYEANPNTSVVGVVAGDALAANRSSFYHVDGSPKTLGEVYNETAKKVGAAGGLASTGQPAQGNPFAQQGKDIDAYRAGLPDMWAKLEAMQNEYKQKAAPTWQQKMEDAISGFQQQQAVSQANMHANAGAIMTHTAQPDASQFVGALKSTHDMAVAERQRENDLAKMSYEMGATALQAKNANALQVLGLTGSLAKEIAGYGIQERQLAQGDRGLDIQKANSDTQSREADTHKQAVDQEAQKISNELEINRAKFGVQSVKDFSEHLERTAPGNPTAQKDILLEFRKQGGVMNGSAESLAKLNQIADEYTKSHTSPDGTVTPPKGMIEKPGPVRTYEIYDPITKETRFEDHPVNDTTWDRKGVVDVKDPTATQVTQTNGGGTSAGGTAPKSPLEEHRSLSILKGKIEDARQILALMDENGNTTGPITDNPTSRKIMGVVRQLTGGKNDKAALHEAWGIVMGQIRQGIVGPAVKQEDSSPSQWQVQQMTETYPGADYSKEAARTLLNHLDHMADHRQGHLVYMDDARESAKDTRQPFREFRSSREYELSHPVPQMDLVQLKPRAANPDIKVIDGVQYHRDPKSPSGWSQ